MDGYEELANAIVLMAVRDYRQAARQLRRSGNYQPAIRMKRDVEQFFHSEWFSRLTRLDGVRLLERLRSEVAA
mgnify:CR=1 FL=1|jgi:hypothetical protein